LNILHLYGILLGHETQKRGDIARTMKKKGQKMENAQRTRVTLSEKSGQGIYPEITVIPRSREMHMKQKSHRNGALI